MATDAFGRIVPDTGATGWHDVSQQETTELDAKGQPTRGYRVYFTTNENHAGSVFVPQNMYSVVNVRAAIAAQAAQLDAVGKLTG